MSDRRRMCGCLLTILLLTVACGGDDTTGPEPVDLSGTYAVVSLQFAGQQPLPAPDQVEGTLILTQTTYVLDLNIKAIGSQIDDNGTYTALSDGTWTQKSAQPDGPQTTGTFEFDGSELAVDAVQSGQRIITVWELVS